MMLWRKTSLPSVLLLVIVGSGVWISHWFKQRNMSRAESLLQKANDLSWLNQWTTAAPVYREAESLFWQRGDKSRALYAHVSQFIPRAETERAPDLLIELNNDLNLPESQAPETRLCVLTIKGMIETNYDASLAVKTWQEVGQLARSQHHYLLASRALGEEGIAAFLLGDVAKAKKDVLAAWELAKVLGDPAARVRYASVYGAGLNEIGRYQEALAPLDEAIETTTKSNRIAYPSIAMNAKIDALRGLRRYSEAIALADSVERKYSSLGLSAHLFELLTAKGRIYEGMQNVDAAIQEYEHAIQFGQQQKLWRGIAETGGLLARAYEQKGDLPRALSTIDLAIEANTQIPFELLCVPGNLAIKAEILRKMGRNQEAHALYEKGALLVDSLLATAPTPNVQRFLIEEMSRVYSGYFETLISEGAYPEAFRVIEMEHGRVETEALEHRDKIAPRAPTPVERHLTELNLRLIHSDDPEERTGLSNAIYQTELHLGETPLGNRARVNPVPLALIQEHLSERDLVLDYVLGESKSYVLAVTRNSVHSYTLPAKKALEGDASAYRKELMTRKSDTVLGERLYSELLSPIPEIQSKDKIVFIPDGELHLLPFAALMSNEKYFVELHTIVVDPSATAFDLLESQQNEKADDPLPYVGVAAWARPQGPKALMLRAIAGPELNEVVPLPQSSKEVEEAGSYLPKPSTILLGSQATETQFKALPLSQFDVIHLALHGYVDLEFPDRSALLFAPQKDGVDDGLLQVREIRNLHLRSRLVTLSACNTGVGPAGAGGVANIVNAFLEAGADSVVSALWGLEDHATEQFMKLFYSHLARNEGKADALRAAQLECLHHGMPPSDWASIELVGDANGTI